MELFEHGDQIFVTEGDMAGKRGEITAVWPAKELTGFNRAEYRVRLEDGTRHTFSEDDIELVDAEMLPVADRTILESGCRLIDSEGESFLERVDVDPQVGDLELAVWPHDTGLPHVHFYFRGQDTEYVAPNGARPWGGCLCLEHARYFDHGSHRQIMDESQMVTLKSYLTERHDGDTTNWQRIISLWNESNPNGKQVPIDTTIPDYRWNMSSTGGSIESDTVGESERERLIGEALERIILADPIDDETFSEMATVTSDKRLQLRIQVNPDRNRKGSPYFKVFDTASPKPGQSKVARLHFSDSGMEYHRDKYFDWEIDQADIDMIRELLLRQHHDIPSYTNWQMACYLWNLEYGWLDTEDRDDYFAGKFNDKFDGEPSYVRHDLSIPESWIYDPPKSQRGKRKGKGT